MPLTDILIVKSWINPGMDDSRDEELERLIDTAGAWVKRVADWEADEAAYTLSLDGNDAIGPQRNILLLPSKYRPVTHAATPVTVTEDGSALVVGTGYDTGDDVTLVGADDGNARLELVKQTTPWSSGYQNILVGFTAGYADADETPFDLKQLVTEVAALMFRTPGWLGKATKSTRGGTLTFEKDLTPQSAQLLTRLKGIV